MYPHFLGIGVPKAGTTWLYENLRQHPQIWLPPVKEIHYFERPKYPYLLDLFHVDSQKRFLLHRWLKPALSDSRQHPRRLNWHLRFFLLPRSWRWYGSLFKPDVGQLAGDITPTYCTLPGAAIAHVARFMPEAKLILILRDPVERIWSHAAMYFRRYGQNGIENANQAEVEAFLRRLDVRARGDYDGMIGRWRAYYPTEQLFIGQYEDLSADPTQFFHTICNFLNIEPLTPPGVAQRVHSGRYPQIPAWARNVVENAHVSNS